MTLYVLISVWFVSVNEWRDPAATEVMRLGQGYPIVWITTCTREESLNMQKENVINGFYPSYAHAIWLSQNKWELFLEW